MRTKWKDRRWLLPALAAFFILLAGLAWLTDIKTGENDVPLIPMHRAGLGMLTPDSAASQTFTVTESGLTAVSAMFSNFNQNGKISAGTLTLRLADASGATVAEESFPCAGQRNNAFLTLRLPQPLTAPAGAAYTLYATADCADAKGVTLRIGPKAEGAAESGLTLADGTADPDDQLYMTLTYFHRSHGWMSVLTCLLAALCFLGALPLALRKEGNDA